MRIEQAQTHARFGTLFPLRVGAVALVFSIVGFPQFSMANTAASASSRLGASNQSDAATGASGQAVSASSSQAGSGNGFATGQASGNANAAEGLLKAFASANGSTDPFPPYNSSVNVAGYGRASWNDNLIIDAGSALLGQSGHISAVLNLSGVHGGNIVGALAVYGGEIGFAHYARMIGTGMSTDSACGGWSYCQSSYTDSLASYGADYFYSDFSPLITLYIPVIFGSLTGLSYTLDVNAAAFVLTRPGRAGTVADAVVDYTLSWGGITGVFDASGNSVSNFTDTSTSGFDYYQQTAPIPEPETYAMLLAGLGLLGFAARRRKLKLAA